MHTFISVWNNFDPKAPFVLAGDEALIDKEKLCYRVRDWDAYIDDKEFGSPQKPQLHLDLFPIPFLGNLNSATVFLLMLNPGLGPHDYFGEYKVPEYIEALRANLRQSPQSSFLFLDPRFAWHGGFDYWHGKFRNLIEAFAKQSGISYGEARLVFQKQVAVIELMPYRSVTYSIPDGVLNSLESVRLARAFVEEELVNRAKSGKCLIIVTRAAKHWN